MSELKPCPFCGESKLLYSGGCGFRYDDDNNQIRLFRVHCRTCKGRTGVFESLDEAVEAWNRRTNSTTIQPSALGTNLAEVGTDCISREQAIETFKDCAVNGVGIDGIVDALKQLPPIQPKRGHWIEADVCGDTTSWECSCCHNWTGLPTGWNVKAKLWFCPKCTADMREVTE